MAVRPQFAISILPIIGALLCACAAEPAQNRPFRSPTRDYPHPPVQTSDGEVVGADRIAPADKLEQGPTQNGLAPGWSLDPEPGKPPYNRKDQVGGHTDHGTDQNDKHDHDHDHDEDSD